MGEVEKAQEYYRRGISELKTVPEVLCQKNKPESDRL